MTKLHNDIIDKIQQGTIVYITDSDNEEMMFVCQKNKFNEWTLYSKDYGHYCPKAKTLDDLVSDIQQDWQNDEITDFEIYDISDGGHQN